MPASKATLRTCPNGHQYYKSSNCPVCPVCEGTRTPTAAFMEGLSAPARRALESAGITTLKKLSSFTEKEILALHGVGPSSIPILKNLLKGNGFQFKEK